MDVADLIQAALSGSTRATGRLLSLIEGDRRDEVLAALDTASARVVGITGPPGAGKSTTIAVLVGAYRERGMRVAVLAVDPSSPYSGGAILADRNPRSHWRSRRRGPRGDPAACSTVLRPDRA